jgi:hypothetical protein
LDGLVSISLRKLGQLVEDEVVMTLSVGGISRGSSKIWKASGQFVGMPKL